MKFAVPEISWHNRDPVLSVDFQPKREENGPSRLATGGTDTHVLIWYITTSDSGSVNLEVAADLTRHQKAVNVVRWAPNGELLASGDDESIIFVWKQKPEEPVQVMSSLDQGEEVYKETWVVYKTLRGHMEDVLDLSWSADSLCLASGSVDNKLLLWDVTRGRYSCILTDHKGFVQGVAWDPKGQMIVSASTDRIFRTFDISTKKVISRSSKAILPFRAGHPLHETKVRLYHDDTLQTYYRRLNFSPDGLFIAVPAGRIEPQEKMDMKPINAVYIYTRYCLKTPAAVLPCGEAALVTCWAPCQLAARVQGTPGPRWVLAVATKKAVLLYDTHQKTPLAIISNIHYTRLTDLSWSSDGRTLVASSTDGFCSVLMFGLHELGQPAPIEKAMETQTEPEQEQTEEQKAGNSKIDAFIKFKAPTKKHPKQKPETAQPKTPVKIDVLVETAMPSWSDNSNSNMNPETGKSSIEIMEIEDSEDMKLIYEDTENKSQSPKEMPSPERKRKSDSPGASTPQGSSFLKQATVRDARAPTITSASPRVPRRVSFVTLSSPKNNKKC